ncbi:MAG: hypothetical protein ACREQR_02370 [Candidatus Binataceae bacterium]
MTPRPMYRWIFLAVSVALLIASDASARPYRGGIPWSFLLCKFSDSPAPPNPESYYNNMAIAPGAKGLDDYVKAISNGHADMTGSVMHGWYTESHTLAYEQGLSDRWQRVQDCIDTAAASATDRYVPPAGQRVYVITSPGVDLAGWENQGAIGGDDVALPEIAHEFGHGIGLNHSWSNDITWKDVSWAGWGEYDNPWDLMSAANVYTDPTGVFGDGPPDLDAHHLDELGFIPKSRILTLGVDGILSRTATLAALTHPEAAGDLLVRIPFDSNDRFHYYTVEYRTADGWDAGIPASIVMINEVNNNGSYYQTTLQRELGSYAGTGDGPPVQSINANGVTISVSGTSGNQATINVSTQFALPCAQGFVWREASSIDRVCVVPAARTQAAADNAQAGARHLPNSATCMQGYVWREAYPGDFTCVTTATRSQAAADDAAAYNSVDETKVTYGPNTCAQGYVWRDGDDNDYVCVSGATRAQAAADNAAAPARHLPNSTTCVQGYVWREAWPGDYVCVTPATRSQAQSDNGQATARLAQLFAMRPASSRFASLAAALDLASPAFAADMEMKEPSAATIAQPHARTMANGPETKGPMGPAPVSESVLRVRLAKLGYSGAAVQKVVRNGNYWDATVTRNGVPQTIRYSAQTGARIEPRPIKMNIPPMEMKKK